MKARLALLPPLALAACVTPQSRVQAGLENAGLKPRLAHCMAARMIDRLSHDQLRALDDPEIVRVTSKAALACEIDHAL
jgi:hypothetical protein